MKLVVLPLLLVFAMPAEAGPKHWFAHPLEELKHQFTEHPVRTAVVVGIGAAAFHASRLHRCRTGDFEHCDEGYGCAWCFFGVLTGASVVAGPAIADGCWKDNPDAKFCNIFAYGFSAYQFGQGLYDWHAYARRHE